MVYPPKDGRLRSLRPPGGTWGYSGAGFVFLTDALESIWKEPAAQCLRRLVLDPLGMSGTRILLSAAIELNEKGKRYALATMCIGVGQGYAVVIEKC